MPKVRRVRSLSRRSSPYVRPPPPAVAAAADPKEWEEARCPICMEQPHNAVVLNCSSHDKGCRPYMCNTSRRHSNCLDQFLKPSSAPCGSHAEPGPLCPLCRGSVHGYSVDGPARAHLDSKPRSCSSEGCGFSGSYPELRRHARSDHPSARPSEVDPARRLDWARLERNWDLDDVLSLVRPIGLEEVGQSDAVGDWSPRSDGLSSFMASLLGFVSMLSSMVSRTPPSSRSRPEIDRATSSARARGGNFSEGDFRAARQLRWRRRRSYHDVFGDRQYRGSTRRRSQRWSDYDNRRRRW